MFADRLRGSGFRDRRCVGVRPRIPGGKATRGARPGRAQGPALARAHRRAPHAQPTSRQGRDRDSGRLVRGLPRRCPVQRLKAAFAGAVRHLAVKYGDSTSGPGLPEALLPRPDGAPRSGPGHLPRLASARAPRELPRRRRWPGAVRRHRRDRLDERGRRRDGSPPLAVDSRVNRLAIGSLGEYILRIDDQSRARPVFVVIGVRRKQMRRLVWPLGLVLTFGLGLAAGGWPARGPFSAQEVARLRASEDRLQLRSALGGSVKPAGILAGPMKERRVCSLSEGPLDEALPGRSHGGWVHVPGPSRAARGFPRRGPGWSHLIGTRGSRRRGFCSDRGRRAESLLSVCRRDERAGRAGALAAHAATGRRAAEDGPSRGGRAPAGPRGGATSEERRAALAPGELR